jgi:hypothetical protein
MKTYNWTVIAGDLLGELTTVLSATINEWKLFEMPEGDIGYFSDFDSSRNPSRHCGYECLRFIKEMFDELQACQRKLTEIQDSCHKLTKVVSQSQIISNYFSINQFC